MNKHTSRLPNGAKQINLRAAGYSRRGSRCHGSCSASSGGCTSLTTLLSSGIKRKNILTRRSSRIKKLYHTESDVNSDVMGSNLSEFMDV